MAMSGVTVDDDVISLFRELKGGSSKSEQGHQMKKKFPDQRLKAVAFKFSKNLEKIEIDEDLTLFPSQDVNKVSEIDYDKEREDWQKLSESLPEKHCRYAVYDLYYNMKSSGLRTKVILVAWAPDKASIKDKMLFASTKDTVKKKLDGIAGECQATDYDELDLPATIATVSRGDAVYDR
ncbi:uncharacterized protein LOC141900538 [Tubulanus polymorphus]|uniref:uncharacterized protein LOC141900538 n=1 Tax=Tubulanus polymorphus TaxID=672921 RepID=UPI003DA3BBB0